MRADDPLSGILVTVIGGSGFLGRHLAGELLARGARLRIASRRPDKAYLIKPLGNLGQVQLAYADVTRPDTLARVMAGADIAINLAGTFGNEMAGVQGTGAGAVAVAARQAAVSALVHVSAIGADPDGDTAYARSKAAGEAAVRAAFPQATVIRPSILFGEDDTFINRFAGLIALLPVLPVFAPDAPLRPLFVDDAARAIAEAVADPTRHGGRVYEIAGEDVLTMATLNRQIADAQLRSTMLVPLPDGVSGAIATLTGWLPGAPITRQQWRLLQAGNQPSGNFPGLQELGISPRPLALFLDRWMVRYRRAGRFAGRVTA